MRERYVTRTVTTATADVMVVMGREVKDREYNIGSVAGLKESDILEKAKKLCPDDCLFVKVNEIKYKDVLYGMLESDFIRLAKVLPSRTSEKAETGE